MQSIVMGKNAKFLNIKGLDISPEQFKSARPFPHIIVSDFFRTEIALQLAGEFPEFQNPLWHEYNNPIEIKKTCNNWNAFPETTYSALELLQSQECLKLLERITGIQRLVSDPGLNGGGWHIHARGGKLNPHLDYSIHPIIGLERILNLIIYLNPDWKLDWGGDFGMWDSSDDQSRPGNLDKTVPPIFNQAVLFQTTGSWHGLACEVDSPRDQCRKSLAVYYLIQPRTGVSDRGKARFAPTKDQENIEKRASVESSSKVWKTS